MCPATENTPKKISDKKCSVINYTVPSACFSGRINKTKKLCGRITHLYCKVWNCCTPKSLFKETHEPKNKK